MGASTFTIYMLDKESDVEKIIEDFNENNETENKKFLLKRNSQFTFDNISNYKLYTRAAETIPEWGKVLDSLVTNLGSINNVNHSYVLFLEVNGEKFAITGGTGYLVLEKYKKYNFGLELLSRLIGENDNYIKRINDRFFTGNKIGSDFQYIGNVTLNSERDFNNFFREIYLALPRDIIQDKLGIEITTKKKDYRFLAKDSIKIGKAITLQELDMLLISIVNLLKSEQTYSINPFSEVNKNDPIIDNLDELFVTSFISYLGSSNRPNDFNIIPFYQTLDQHSIQIKGTEIKETYHSEKDIIDFFITHIDTDKDIPTLIKIIEEDILLKGYIENEEITSVSLYKHFDCKVIFKNKTYWLMEGNWFLLERSFLEEVNKKFLEKITNIFDLNFNLNNIKTWAEQSEGDFNFQHNSVNNTYVLDKILVNNIEICDILIEVQDKIYFVHVKDGLDGDVRMLVAQIEFAMRTIREGTIYNKRTLINYYNSISNKVSAQKTNGDKTEQAISASRFIKRFPDQESFISLLKSKEKVFVFAYRPLDSHNFKNPSTITSTAAKLSMINLTETAKEYDYELKFLKISRDNNQSQIVTKKETIETII